MTREQLIQQALQTTGDILKRVTSQMRFLQRDYELSRPQMYILFSVAKSDKGLNVKDLASNLNVTSAAITQFTDDLVDKKLLTREEDPDDRRGVRLSLTKKARESFTKYKAGYFKQLAPLFKDFTDQQLRDLVSLLSMVKLEDNE